MELSARQISSDRFKDQLKRDGYGYHDGTITPITAAERLADAKAIAATFDAGHIHAQISALKHQLTPTPRLLSARRRSLWKAASRPSSESAELTWWRR